MEAGGPGKPLAGERLLPVAVLMVKAGSGLTEVSVVGKPPLTGGNPGLPGVACGHRS